MRSAAKGSPFATKDREEPKRADPTRRASRPQPAGWRHAAVTCARYPWAAGGNAPAYLCRNCSVRVLHHWRFRRASAPRPEPLFLLRFQADALPPRTSSAGCGIAYNLATRIFHARESCLFAMRAKLWRPFDQACGQRQADERQGPFFLAVERAKSRAKALLGTLGDIAMRHPRLSSTHIVAAALVLAGVLAPMSVFAQAQPPAQAPAPVLGPYKPVPITLPAGGNAPGFAAVRTHPGVLARKKDSAALARLVAANFFWVPEQKDIADKQKSGIDNLAKALSLDGTDGFGWEALAAYAAETTVMADPQRKGVFCAPADPIFDEKA